MHHVDELKLYTCTSSFNESYDIFYFSRNSIRKKNPEDLIKRRPVASYMQQWQVTSCFK